MADRSSQKALAEFVSEAQETNETLERELIRLEDGRHGSEADPDALNAVFRAAHTLKGLASMFGVERMTKLAHALEDKLDALRMGRQPCDDATTALALAAPPVFSRIIAEEARGAPAASTEAAEQLAIRLRAAFTPPARPADAVAEYGVDPDVLSVLTEYEEHRLRANLAKGMRLWRVRAAFDLASFDTGLEQLKQRLKRLGEVIATLPSAEAGDPSGIAFDVLLGSAAAQAELGAAAGSEAVVAEVPRQPATHVQRISDPPPFALGAAADLAPLPPGLHARPSSPLGAPTRAELPGTLASLAHPESAGGMDTGASPLTEVDRTLRSVSQAVKVDIHKLDRLMNVVGELVLVKTSLLKIAGRLRSGEGAGTSLGLELHRESRTLERKLDDLQAGILEVRMVPVGQIFDKLSRMVRKLTRELGKEIDFQVKGSNVELDKLIVEDLSDPLMHLIRNSLDHGVDPPEKRLAQGKPRAGRITLSATQKGSHVQITVEDDGNGIDEGRIREVAVARGLASAEQVSQLSRREVMNLIFVPGFSTAKQVTALSGRGVGMDVVKNNVAKLSGIIELSSELGKGTRIEITLPVTLAIIRALVVDVARHTYAVPLNSVLEILTLDPRELKTIETREVINLRGSTLPLVRLGRFFGLPEAPAKGPLFVVVVGLAQERLGVAVEGLVGQQDIVVKPLGKALSTIRGIAGATDLGGRRTVLVLDVGAIMEEVVHGDAGLAEAAG